MLTVLWFFNGFGSGRLLGLSWDLLGPSCGPLGGSWRFLGGLLGPAWATWAPLGASWGLLGTLWGPSWWLLGASGWLLASLGSLLARFGSLLACFLLPDGGMCPELHFRQWNSANYLSWFCLACFDIKVVGFDSAYFAFAFEGGPPGILGRSTGHPRVVHRLASGAMSAVSRHGRSPIAEEFVTEFGPNGAYWGRR